MKTTWSAHSLNWHIVALWSDFHPSTRDGASANKQVNHPLRTFNWWRHGPHFAGAGKSTSSALCLQAPAIEFKTFETLQIASNMFQNGNTFHQPKVNKSVVWRENSKRETAPKEKRLVFSGIFFLMERVGAWWAAHFHSNVKMTVFARQFVALSHGQNRAACAFSPLDAKTAINLINCHVNRQLIV